MDNASLRGRVVKVQCLNDHLSKPMSKPRGTASQAHSSARSPSRNLASLVDSMEECELVTHGHRHGDCLPGSVGGVSYGNGARSSTQGRQ